MTICVNMFAGAGAGKSTITGTFYVYDDEVLICIRIHKNTGMEWKIKLKTIKSTKNIRKST